jgi:type II secretory pathway pseudopilin PulG
MEDILVWLFWAAIIIGSIASSASKAKKKREEEAARQARQAAAAQQARQARQTVAAWQRSETDDYDSMPGNYGTVWESSGTGAGSDAGSGREAKPVIGGSFGKLLEELSRQLEEQPTPPFVARPLSRPVAQPMPVAQAGSADRTQPAATSYDYYSLEEEYDTTDGRGYRSEQSAEDFDAERRYIGGELSPLWEGSGSIGDDLHSGGMKGSAVRSDRFEAEIAEYDRLAAWRTHRSPLVTATTAAETVTKQTANRAIMNPTISAPATDIAAVDNIPEEGSATMRELLDGDFDLRRAIIETEILTPKYV